MVIVLGVWENQELVVGIQILDSVVERLCQTCRDALKNDCDEPVKQSTVEASGEAKLITPPSGIAPPSSTTTCPGNTALDANGNCAPVTQIPKEPPQSTDQQGTTQSPPPSDDNKPSKPKLPKGDILGLQPTDRKGRQSPS